MPYVFLCVTALQLAQREAGDAEVMTPGLSTPKALWVSEEAGEPPLPSAERGSRARAASQEDSLEPMVPPSCVHLSLRVRQTQRCGPTSCFSRW